MDTLLLVYTLTQTIGITIERKLVFQTCHYKESCADTLLYVKAYVLCLNSDKFT